MHRAVPAVLLAALIALAGCGMLGDDQPPSDDRALEVRNETVDALENVDTYRMSMDADVSASAEGRSRSLSVDSDGVVNRTSQRMRMNTSSQGRTVTSYLDERTVYTKCPSPWSGWGTQNQSTDVEWLSLTPLGRQVELFEQTNVYWDGTATIDGEETAVIVAHPSQETVSSLPGQSQTDLANTDATVENITAKLWVDQETSRPVRSLLQIQISGNGGEATANVMIDYEAYGEPVHVDDPAITGETWQGGCPGA
ncbi:membrane lipoprotein [Halorhabdus tiamatea SARL4B]|uniref:Membrane lipoprotein n=1 Tax=Halorhabdus tiamatea SARL4B TaxID=1033806 RepID=F7PQA6_9EURY|nr:hypothetical protein [Halorhabdus tiamatea]ERJ04990.1 membrane lipoprotein [Halorhabdus tiamatea SARL4B]CCQ33234.1 conserved hypothetical protein [Halorhabdus tiamatea SARL4B]